MPRASGRAGRASRRRTSSPARRLDGKIAIVTGAAQGIGAATSRLLAREGAAVLVADLNVAKGRAVAQAIRKEGARALFQKLDVVSEAGWKRVIARAIERFGGLHILVNNAGVAIPNNIETTSRADWRRVVAINLEGPFLGMKHAIPVIRSSGGGSIVNIASSLALVGATGSTAYCASKWGLRGLTRSAALYCAKQGYRIRVNTICPGAVETPLLERQLKRHPKGREAALKEIIAAEIPIGYAGRPDDIAHGVLYLACDESDFATGTDLVIDGGHRAE